MKSEPSMAFWKKFSDDQYLSLVPWAWCDLERSRPSAPFPYLGGVAPEVVASLYEAHQLLLHAIGAAINDVVSRRASSDDPLLRVRMEDAYTELVNSRADLRAHIRCGRQADGTFQWQFPLDPTQSAPVTFSGLQLVNTVTKQSVPFGFEPSIAPAIGKVLGLLDGTRSASEIRQATAAGDPDVERELVRLIDLLHTQHCLVVGPWASVRARWLAETRDGDVVHLGHAGLLYRHREDFWLFDPWLMPWFAGAPVPSLWGSLLPRPAAILLTHEHMDHTNLRTLLHVPKDVPVIVPSRTDRCALFHDYVTVLRQLGFDRIIELPHGDHWDFEGGMIVSVPFYGEDPCDLELPRNCYLVVDRGRNTLVQADSGPTNSGRSAVKEGVIDELVQQYGPITTVFASQQQLRDVRGNAETACLSPPGRWLETCEDGYLEHEYLAQLAACARARMFVSYATGGAEWFSDDLSFVFNPRKPARTAFLTANWEPLEQLEEWLRPYGCRYHYSQALDLYRPTVDGGIQIISAAEALSPARLLSSDGARAS